jgi:preprotein translocase subunit SecF
MGGLSNLYRGRNDVDFPRLFRPVFTASMILILVSIVSLFVRGLNLSIEFKGGSEWDVPSETLTVAQAQDVLGQFNSEGGSQVTEVKDADGHRIIRVQAASKDVAASQTIAAAFAKRTDQKVENINATTIGPSWGKEITSKALQSLITFLVLVALYIAWQLEWRMAVAALAGVAHDIIVTVGLYSIFHFDVTPATVISFLTILGYSLYDTIVVYDRLKENSARYDRSGQYTYTGVLRRSLNQVMMRSTNTTTVSLLPVLSMLVVGSIIFGQTVLKDFSLALLIGLFSGAYSSIFVASPVLAWLKEREPKYRRVRQRAIERDEIDRAEHIPVGVGSVAGPLVTASTAGAGDGVGSDTATITATTTAAKAAQYQRPHPPRPRKQGKRR